MNYVGTREKVGQEGIKGSPKKFSNKPRNSCKQKPEKERIEVDHLLSGGRRSEKKNARSELSGQEVDDEVGAKLGRTLTPKRGKYGGGEKQDF